MQNQQPWTIEDPQTKPWTIESEKAEKQADVPKGSYLGNLARTFVGQGLGMGSGEEIEAGIRSGLSKFTSNPKTYLQMRDQLRLQIKQFQTENPGTAITSEVIGGLIPTVALMVAGVGTGGSTTAAGAGNVARMLNTGKNIIGAGKNTVASAATAGAIAGVGYSEEDDLPGLVEDAAKSAGLSAAGTKVLSGGGKLVGSTFNKLMEKTRRVAGDEYVGPVQEFLIKQMKTTGKTLDETIDDIRRGGVMAEDDQLSPILKVLASQGNEAAGDVKNAATARAARTLDQANKSVREALAPDVDDANVLRALQTSSDDLQAKQSIEYEKIFTKAQGPVPKGLSDKMKGILQKNPKARSKLSELYVNDDTTTPFFKIVRNEETGKDIVNFSREPKLQDAEKLLRRMETMSRKEFETSTGDPDLGRQLKIVANRLRKDIDNLSPELAAVRADFASREAVDSAVKLGKSMSKKSADEVEVVLAGLSPEEQAGFRAGMQMGIRDQMTRSSESFPGIAGGLDRSNKNPNEVLQAILPENKASGVIDDLATAGRSQEAKKAANLTKGPITYAATQAQKNLDNVGQAATFTAQLNQNNLLGAMGTLARKFLPEPKVLGLTPEQAQTAVKVLFSEEPDFVLRALADDTLAGDATRKLAKIAQNIEMASRNVTQRQAQGLLAD